MSEQPETTVDFEAAEMFLHQARDAAARGDAQQSFAARKMVALALGLTDGPTPIFHLSHLKAAG